MTSKRKNLALAIATLLTTALGLSLSHPGDRKEKDGKPPAIKGDIKCRAVSQFPGRDQDNFGVGEDVNYWIDPQDGEGPEAVIAWYSTGGTVYPIVGTATVVSVDILPGTLNVWAWRRDPRPRTEAVEEKMSAAALEKWLREQLATLPKRQPDPDDRERSVGIPKELQAELDKLDGLRKGADTPFAQIDETGKKLLAKYTEPRERGQIYATLAHLHAQSGLVHPQKTADYARQALHHPLNPRQTPRMYSYWGDAVQIIKAEEMKTSYSGRRKWAALLYLAGLREVLRDPLPAKVIEPTMVTIDLGFFRDPPPGKEKEAKRKLEEYTAAQETSYFQRDMIQHRDTLTRQLADLYLHRRPDGSEELAQLAGGVLRDLRLTEQFMRAVKGGRWE